MNVTAKQILRKGILYAILFFAYIVLVALGFLAVQELRNDLLIPYTFASAMLATVAVLYKLRWVLFPDLCKLLTVSKSIWDRLWDMGADAICKKTK